MDMLNVAIDPTNAQALLPAILKNVLENFRSDFILQ
jgi:hypothetical protein